MRWNSSSLTTDRPTNSWQVISRSGVPCHRIANSGARAACLFGLDRTRAPFVLFLDADDELAPGAVARILDCLDPDIAKLQFPLTRIDADGAVISPGIPALEDFRDRDGLQRLVLRQGVYTSPPTSGNVFRRDLCEILREADYDSFVDGAILFAAPFYGDVLSLSEELGRYRIHGRNDSGLGQLPQAATLERDLKRFVARMDHLRRILDRQGLGHRLVRPQDTYFFLETEFHARMARGERPSLTDMGRLLGALWRDPRSPRVRGALAAFFLLATILPNRRSQPLLAYRLKAGSRSMRGFLRVMMAPR
ncbi:glycosyltransferase [Paenirhodobacter sp.]|uniref:glycosyltransferase n=1 Tax=Paenirhodobacter sp. TaxID=1965326 RepID=UPI003B41709D